MATRRSWNGQQSSTVRRSARMNWSATSEPACLRGSTRSSAPSRLACRISSKARSSTRRPARSGMCCAISTATTAGIRGDQHRARAGLRTRSAVSAAQAAGRIRTARAIAGALGPRTDLQLLPARYADPDVQLCRPCPTAAGHRRRPHLLALGIQVHHAARGCRAVDADGRGTDLPSRLRIPFAGT